MRDGNMIFLLKHASFPHESHSVQLVDDRRVATVLRFCGCPGGARLRTRVRHVGFFAVVAHTLHYRRAILKTLPPGKVLAVFLTEK